MTCFRNYPQRKFIQIGLVLLFVSLLSGSEIRLSYAQLKTDTAPATVSDEEQVQKLLEEADTYFQQQEFVASYDLYLRALGLDPSNQHAREKIYEIINTYKILVETAQKEGSPDQAKLFYQKYRNMIRSLLQTLTTQLKQGIQQYSELVAAQKNGDNIAEEAVPVLKNVIQILQDLKTLYEDFPQEDSGTEKIVARIDQTIKKYEQELSYYQE